MSEEELIAGASPRPAEPSTGSMAAPGSAAPGDAPAPLGALPAPVNKVHEWTAAAVIVAFLTLVLVGFVYFMRGASI